MKQQHKTKKDPRKTSETNICKPRSPGEKILGYKRFPHQKKSAKTIILKQIEGPF